MRIGNSKLGDGVLIDHFLPEGIVWEDMQAEVDSPDIDIWQEEKI